jgi:Zn-dependent peptidase ImmA (M78 family)
MKIATNHDRLYQNEALNEIVAVDRFKHLDLSEIDKTFPVPVGTLASRLELNVEYSNLEARHSGFLSGDNIFLNEGYPAVRNRFTMSHKICHYLYDGDSDRFDDTNKYDKESIEKEIRANRFAANLLMPQKKFIEIYLGYDKNKWKTSDFFGVSSAAVQYRALNFGLSNNI